MLVLGTAALFVPLRAQGVVRTVYNPNLQAGGGNSSGFGETRLTKGMGDLDGDGRADFGFAVPNSVAWSLPAAGQAVAYSGASGAVIHSLFASPPVYFGSGGFDAGRDADGDGIPDFALGAIHGSSPGGVYLISGATGTTLRSLQGTYVGDNFGMYVVLADCNGDGYADVVGSTVYHQIGGPGGTRVTQILAQSGRDGSVLWQAQGMGVGLVSIGDANGDGCDDIVAGSILSGADGSAIRPYSMGITPGYLWDICAAGDVDGDGIQDFLVSFHYSVGLLDRGATVLVSGGSGLPLRTHLGVQAGDRLGQAVAGGFHADNDGVPDYAIRAYRTVLWTPTSGRVDIYSGATGAVIQSWTTPWNERQGGIAAVGDTDGDGTDELVFGAPEDDTACPGCGRAYVYQIRQGPVGSFRTYGKGCPGSNLRLPTAGARGQPRVSHTMELTLRAGHASSLVIAAVGWPATTSLAPIGAPGCWAHIDPFWWLFVPTDAFGRSVLPVALPNDPSVSGLRLDSQWVGIDPAANQLGVTTSTAVAITIGS